MADNLGNAARSVSDIKNEVMEIKNILSEMNYNSEIEKANDGMLQMIGTMANVVSLVNGGVEGL